MSAPATSMQPVEASVIARRYGLDLVGSDATVETMGTVETAFGAPALSFALSLGWAQRADPSIRVIVCPPSLAHEYQGPATLLTTRERNPQDVFYEIFYDSAVEGRWNRVERRIDESASIADSAFLGEHVVIGRDCTVMAGAVLLDNTVLAPGVTIKPNAVLGGDGFQVRVIAGRQVVVPHVGGVYVAESASIGSQTCVDRGLFGESTSVGANAQVDNLVHVAHAAEVGPDAVVVACSEISGGVRLGRGAWLGPNCAINQGLVLGDYSFVGTGSAVVRDIPAHGMAFGNPAKLRGWVCSCREKLPSNDAADARVTCGSCGRTYRLSADSVTAL